MKVGKLVIAVLLFLGFTIPVFAQSDIKDSTEVYQYWARRGIIEMVYAHMNDYVEAVGEPKAKNEILGKDKYETQFISDIDKKELLDLDAVSSFLVSNSWEGIEKSLFQPLIKNLNDTLPLKIQFFLNTKRNISKTKGESNLVPIDYISGPGGYSDINKRVYWKNKGEEIIENYQKELANLSKLALKPHEVKDVLVAPLVEERQEPQNQLPQSNTHWIQSLGYPIFFVLGLLFGGWLVFFISKRKIYKILEYEKSKYLQELRLVDKSFVFKYIGLVHILKESKDEYKKNEGDQINQNKALVATLNESNTKRLQNEHLESKKQQAPIDRTKEDFKITETPRMQEREVKTPEKAKLFFSIPASDGRFNNHNGDPINDGKKFYCIEFEESAEEGSLLFITSDRDKRAINRLESYLIPVCDIENYSDAESASHITLISPGKVTLINDSWVIDSERKVKIKLI